LRAFLSFPRAATSGELFSGLATSGGVAGGGGAAGASVSRARGGGSSAKTLPGLGSMVVEGTLAPGRGSSRDLLARDVWGVSCQRCTALRAQPLANPTPMAVKP